MSANSEKGIDPYTKPTTDDSLAQVRVPKGQIQSSHAEEAHPVAKPTKTPEQRGIDFACPYCYFQGGAAFIGDDYHGRQNVWMCPSCRSLFSLIDNKWRPIFNPTYNQAEEREAEIESKPLGPHKQNEKISDQIPSSMPDWSPKAVRPYTLQPKKPTRCPFCFGTQFERQRNSWVCEVCRMVYQDGINNSSTAINLYPNVITTVDNTGTEGGEFGLNTDTEIIKQEIISAEDMNTLNMTLRDWVGKDWNPFKEYLLRYIKEMKFRFAGPSSPRELPRITRAEKEQIKEIFEEGFQHNRSVNYIAEKIQGVTGDFERAMRIARTESVRIVNESFLEYIKERGIFHRVRFVCGPEFMGFTQRRNPRTGHITETAYMNPCEQCSDYCGKIFTISAAHGKIPVHPNCRCHWEVVADS